MNIERRFCTTQGLQIEERADGPPLIRGHAIVFDALSVVIWSFRERIRKGAFAESIEKDDIRSLWNHDSSRVLGRVQAGTMRCWEDDTGVAFSVEPPDTQAGQDALTSIRRGDVSQMSFGFRALPQGVEWSEDEDGQLIRTITKGTLYEVSPVTFPAYPQTSADVRTIEVAGAVREYSDIYGLRPEIPVKLRRAPDLTIDGDEAAMRAHAARSRRLQLAELI